MIPLSFWYLDLGRLSCSAIERTFVFAFVCYLDGLTLLVAVRRFLTNLDGENFVQY